MASKQNRTKTGSVLHVVSLTCVLVLNVEFGNSDCNCAKTSDTEGKHHLLCGIVFYYSFIRSAA